MMIDVLFKKMNNTIVFNIECLRATKHTKLRKYADSVYVEQSLHIGMRHLGVYHIVHIMLLIK
jgi:hypothetical protein